jgi:hypothetical protein
MWENYRLQQLYKKVSFSGIFRAAKTRELTVRLLQEDIK